jgi:SAM-dependent methyltransferase
MRHQRACHHDREARARRTRRDTSRVAIERAERKAAQRGVSARFLVWDALDLPCLGERFDTVLDCGLFHVFDDEDRARYIERVGVAVAPGGRYLMLCFSDRVPGDWGPRRVRRDEIESSFADGWRIESIDPVTLDITIAPHSVPAWRSSIVRRPAM